MEDFCLIRCDSLDAGSGCDREAMTPIDHMPFDPEGPDPAVNLEPSPAELAQCEAEVGTLLSIIAELNKKMGSLKAPSEPGDLRPPRPPRPLVPDLLSHRLTRTSPDRNTSTSRPPLTDRGGSGVMWSRLQEVLSSVEDSISCKRSWAAPITASDQDKHRHHLKAAQESWVKATEILKEMETEFGISCPSGLPKDQHQEDIQDQERRDSGLRSPVQGHPEDVDEDKNKLEERLVGLQRSWRPGSRSPPYWPSAGAFSPDWASPPFPGSPLLHRRSRGVSDASSVGSAASCSPCPSPISLESETERLNRCIERLRARNERLTAALERRKAETEHVTVALNRLQAHCSALQMALHYSEECEEAYGELLSLQHTTKSHSVPPHTHSAGSDGDAPSDQLQGNEELSTSFCSAGGAEETQSDAKGQSPPGLVEREAFLRHRIQLLKTDRAKLCLPKPSPVVEGKTFPSSGHPSRLRAGHVSKDNTKPPDTKTEKASLFHELISVREEMSDLRGLIRLKEKELRCLEWGLMAQRAQEAAGAFAPESVREETDDQQRPSENASKLSSDGDIDPRTRPILKELQSVLQREQALKKRLALVQDSLTTALSDSSPHRRDNGEQIARLTQAHSKALSSYRQIRRKYREQVWRLEQKVAAMTEGQQGGGAKGGGESPEWRREETVL